MTRPRLKIICADHDEVIAKVVDTDEGPAYGNPEPLSKNIEDLGGHLDLDLYRVARRVPYGLHASGPERGPDRGSAALPTRGARPGPGLLSPLSPNEGRAGGPGPDREAGNVAHLRLTLC